MPCRSSPAPTAGRPPSTDHGFTLVEVLVVILVIGVLTAIALPVFLGQETKGQDVAAKSDARNAVTQIESCYIKEQDYTHCVDGHSAMQSAQLPRSVRVTATPDTYKAQATSKSHNTFSIEKDDTGRFTRTCTTAGAGGCSETADSGGNSW